MKSPESAGKNRFCLTPIVARNDVAGSDVFARIHHRGLGSGAVSECAANRAELARRYLRMASIPAGHFFEHRLALELDGGVHSQINQMRKDAGKEDYLLTLGIRLLRIPNATVLENPDEFVREVVEAVRAPVETATYQAESAAGLQLSRKQRLPIYRAKRRGFRGTFKLAAATGTVRLRHPVDIPRQLPRLFVGEFRGHMYTSIVAA